MSEIRKYKKPVSYDLTTLNAEGGTLGICTTGYYPYSSCSQGFSWGSGSCNPGTSPETGTQCFPFGSSANNTCSTGAYA